MREGLLPDRHVAVQAAQPLAALALGRVAGVVDQRVQLLPAENVVQPLDRARQLAGQLEVDGDVLVPLVARTLGAEPRRASR